MRQKLKFLLICLKIYNLGCKFELFANIKMHWNDIDINNQ